MLCFIRNLQDKLQYYFTGSLLSCGSIGAVPERYHIRKHVLFLQAVQEHL
ncbi:hypothetical protein HMPREF9406_0854 [Clostridium sp. HGF2]|nr:hypothetical protein HMPREF9406_0854 [Clostridium sp. HGF2]EQJ63579.1 putative lipoprotein [Clostridioides difficile P28]